MHITGARILHERFPTDVVYPFNLEIIQKTDSIGLSRFVTFFMGENGTGKSTLLRAIAKKCSIHIGKDAERYRFRPNKCKDGLFRYVDVEMPGGKVTGSFFASELFLYFAEVPDEWAIADRGTLIYLRDESLIRRSHGQSHMAFFSKPVQQGRGFSFLMNPGTHSLQKARSRCWTCLKNVTSAGQVQCIIATHSRITPHLKKASSLFCAGRLNRGCYLHTHSVTEPPPGRPSGRRRASHTGMQGRNSLHHMYPVRQS